MDFATFVFDQLPPPPRRVLEIGCGREGGLVEQLVAHGYDALGVDPDAPEGERFRRAEFQTVSGEWDAVVAGRVLHHVNPLGESLDHLATLAPLLVVDEFAWNLIDAAAQDWYEGQHRMLRAAGAEPYGPAITRRLALAPSRSPPATSWCCASCARATTRSRSSACRICTAGWVARVEALEQTLVGAGAFPAIGYRWAGSSTSTTLSSADAR